MRHTFLFTVAALILVACHEPPTAPASDRTPALRSDLTTNSAITLNSNVSIPIELLVFVPCAAGGVGEVIDVSGPLHVLQTLTISNSGNVSDLFHFQPQGISGVGLSTGDKYQATGITQFKDHFNGLPFSSSFINNFYMIGQGPGNNFKVHETFHFTVNANGDLTAFVDNFFVTCK